MHSPQRLAHPGTEKGRLNSVALIATASAGKVSVCAED